MATQFITDSMMDADKGLSEKYDYEVLPIPISVGNQSYFDGVDITPEMVMEFGTEGQDFPKTSQIPMVTYKEAFEKHLKNGDDVVYVGLSSGLSGTMQAANLAAMELAEEYPDRKIVLIDSKGATIAQTMIFEQGLKQREAGKSIEEIEETLNFLTDHLNVYFVAGDLDWLRRGGRLGRSAATLGTLLKINPILYITDEGKIELFSKVRGKKKALKKLEDLLAEGLENNPDQTIAVIGSKNDEFVDALKDVTKDYDETQIMEPEDGAGSALTVHIGDDFYGVGFFDELPENYIN